MCHPRAFGDGAVARPVAPPTGCSRDGDELVAGHTMPIRGTTGAVTRVHLGGGSGGKAIVDRGMGATPLDRFGGLAEIMVRGADTTWLRTT
jgi:hypothetical protein